MSPQEANLYRFLKERRGQVVLKSEILGFMYPNPNMEPTYPDTVLRKVIYELRHRHGIELETVYGYRLP